MQEPARPGRAKHPCHLGNVGHGGFAQCESRSGLQKKPPCHLQLRLRLQVHVGAASAARGAARIQQVAQRRAPRAFPELLWGAAEPWALKSCPPCALCELVTPGFGPNSSSGLRWALALCSLHPQPLLLLPAAPRQLSGLCRFLCASCRHSSTSESEGERGEKVLCCVDYCVFVIWNGISCRYSISQR